MDDFDLFIACEKGNAIKAAEQVASDPLIFAGVKKWQKLNEHQLGQFFERSVRLCSEAMHAPLVVVQTFKTPKKKDNHITLGTHTESFDGGTVSVNLHPDARPLLTAEGFLNTASHEMTHEKQKKIARQPSTIEPQFASSIPALIRNNLENYIPSSTDPIAYRNQPVERHAFAVGETFSQAVLNFVSARKFLPNPFNEKAVEEEFEQLAQIRNERALSLPHPNGIETADPYRHYYSGLLAETRLSNVASGHATDPKWSRAIQHYRQALLCGEYLSHDPMPALEGLNRFASNQVWNDRSPQPTLIEVPERIQEQAREFLTEFRESEKPILRKSASRMLERLDRSATPVSVQTLKPQVV